MDVPSTPACISVAPQRPALMKPGVLMMSIHLSVFYFAILSAITPRKGVRPLRMQP